MRHLCESCREISVGSEAVAAVLHRMSFEGDVVRKTLRNPQFPGVDDLRRRSTESSPAKKPCHLCALILRSLKSPDSIGTSDEEFSLPVGPISLDISVRGDEKALVSRAGSIWGSPITLSLDSDESCRGAEVSTESDSEEVFTNILTWCNDCNNQHKQCSSVNNNETWLPSRVIDVGLQGGEPEIKLRDTQGSIGRYITLTHRWTPLTEASGTTNSNIGRRRVSIDLSELSETFRDAVEATRKLGIQFLWIDAICIIQDSREDWRTEAKNMASIYELAWLNIASAGSERMEGRLFMNRDSRLSRPCRVGGDIYAYLDSEFYAQAVFSGFLSRRGWILQERLLSPRTIYFSREEVFWECNHMIASESVPWGWENHTSMVKINYPLRQLKRNQDEVREKTAHIPSFDKISPDSVIDAKRLRIAIQPTSLTSLFEYWSRIVEIYSKKKLTVDMDKLLAIHGIAQALHKSRMAHESFEKCYYNGIWTADLTRELLWIGEPGELALDYLVTNSIRIFTDRIPKYTWASCKTAIKFLLSQPPSVSHIDNIQLLPEEQVISSGWMDKVSSEYLTLPDFNTKISPGSIQFDGQLEIGTLHMDAPELVDPSVLITGLLTFDGNESVITDIIIDSSYLVDGSLSWLDYSNGTVWCLDIASADEVAISEDVRWPFSTNVTGATSSPSVFTFGLILVPTEEFLQSLEDSRGRLATQKEMSSEMWNTWYLTTTPVSFRRIGVYKSCGHPIPNTSVTTIVLA